MRLAAAYRFDTKEVFVRRDKKTGDVILSKHPDDWYGLFGALVGLAVPENFLIGRNHTNKSGTRDPLKSVDVV